MKRKSASRYAARARLYRPVPTLEILEARSSPTDLGLTASRWLGDPLAGSAGGAKDPFAALATEVTRSPYALLGDLEQSGAPASGPVSAPTEAAAAPARFQPAPSPSVAEVQVPAFDPGQLFQALEDVFSHPLTRPASPAGLPDNNGGALAGSGTGPGGVSTPAVQSGGGSGGGGGTGGNSNQLLADYLNMVGSALTPAATPKAAATPLAGGQAAPAAPATTSPQRQQASTTLAGPLAASSLTSSTLSHGSHGHDPLYVLDLNTGETVPANVTLNSFSTWGENLQAQVSGATVSSYSWNTTNAPDLTNVTGQNTFNLQGTWASFTGPARTEAITITETPTVGQPLSQTITFLVGGTDSPAYSGTRPTSSSTWPSVLTPDQVTATQETVGAGPYARLGLADGAVQTAFIMPSYNPGPGSPSVGHPPS